MHPDKHLYRQSNSFTEESTAGRSHHHDNDNKNVDEELGAPVTIDMSGVASSAATSHDSNGYGMSQEGLLKSARCKGLTTTVSSNGIHEDVKPQSHSSGSGDQTHNNMLSTAIPSTKDSSQNRKKRQWIITYWKQLSGPWMQSHWPVLLVSAVVFVVFAGAGIAVSLVVDKSDQHEHNAAVLNLARETGAWFASELDYAILPLFSIAQFATELEIFANLPNQIKSPGEPGALPFVPQPANSTKMSRNVTGVCDEPYLVKRFTEIATAIKHNAKMDGILHNIQLAPQGVICLLHPMNNTEDFPDGKGFLDSTSAWGYDLLNDPSQRFIARKSMQQDKISIVGPRRIVQCPTCGMYFVLRLPVVSRTHIINIDGDPEYKWGFAIALLNWDALVNKSDIQERFKATHYEFQLTRTDHIYNETTGQYSQDVVVLANSTGFGSKTKSVSQSLQTTNNEWVITIQYNHPNDTTYLVIVASLIVAWFISSLVFTVLIQKQTQTAMLGATMAEKAQVELERKLTGALAHELRNPLSAIDSALATMPDILPVEAKELVASMQLCSNFMSNIMNNLLDSRKLEEGKMTLQSNPMSLKQLLMDVRKMMLPAVNANVRLIADAHSIPPEKEWVYGDFSRLQQVVTNLVSNAAKFTRKGSITIAASWEQRDTNTKEAVGEEWVKLVCSDTGPGIPKEEQANLFNRFTTRGGAPGSGLGLAIARQLVELNGGTIHFESDPTVKPGTDCVVMLPLKVCHEMREPTPEAISAAIENTVPLEAPLQILLTDDIKMNRTMFKRRFQKCIAPNCIVSEAATGEDAFRMCQTQHFDIIVMDQYMQEAGGIMLGTDTIIALRRSNVDAVVIGCSGNDLEDKFTAAGADLIWKKPLPSNAAIIASLRQLLDARGSRHFAGC